MLTHEHHSHALEVIVNFTLAASLATLVGIIFLT